MMELRQVSDMVYANTEDRKRMEQMNNVYYQMADYIKQMNPAKYMEFLEEAEDIAYHYDHEDAEHAVRNMKPYGEHWTYADIKNYLADKGVEDDELCDYYVVMNMAYNDYRRTAERYGIDRPEFYYDIAYDYINDEDADMHKVAKNLIY